MDCGILSETPQLLYPTQFHLPGFNLICNEGNFNQNNGVLVYVTTDLNTNTTNTNSNIKFQYKIVKVQNLFSA